jgi:hypothetical protein
MTEVPTTLPDEQIEQIIRLEGIFSPHARRQREAKREQDNPGLAVYQGASGKFAHYTTADAGLKIIRSKRLWMRSTTCMADYREVQHGHDLLVKYFSDQTRKARFFGVMDNVHPGKALSAVNKFDGWWQQIAVRTFVTSVSEHDSVTEDSFGRLSMWRAFGGTVPRVAIVFSVPWYTPATAALGVQFSPVAYLGEAAALAILDEVVSNVEQETAFLQALTPEWFESWLFNTFVAAVCCSKHEGFWEEKEWRGVFTPALGLPSILERSTETIAGVPQPILSIPFDAVAYPQMADLDMGKIIERVIIGPTPYPWVMYEAFVEAMRAIGVPNPETKVVASDLPIRG